MGLGEEFAFILDTMGNRWGVTWWGLCFTRQRWAVSFLTWLHWTAEGQTVSESTPCLRHALSNAQEMPILPKK